MGWSAQRREAGHNAWTFLDKVAVFVCLSKPIAQPQSVFGSFGLANHIGTRIYDEDPFKRRPAPQSIPTLFKMSSAASHGWYYSPELGFIHTEHCTACYAYAMHLSCSLHKPLELKVVLEHCERFRAERNQMSLVLTQSKKELEFYRDGYLRQSAEIDSLKKSTRAVHSNIPDHDDTQSTTITSSHRNTRAPRTVVQLQSLMAAAHDPGNVRALTKVKALCAEAHATPRELKTPLQQYLLVHWRNPEHDAQDSAADRINQSRSKTNPRRDDPIEVWYDYLCTHQTSWPRGVRRDANNHPFLPDLKASRAIAQIRPADVQVASPSSGGANLRFEFMSVLIALLDTRGLYENILDENNIAVSPIHNFKPYHPSYPITIDFVARHLADCGITVQKAREELEPWAHQYKLSSI